MACPVILLALCVDAQIYHSKLYVLFLVVPTVLLGATFNVLYICNIFHLYHNVLKHFDIIRCLMLTMLSVNEFSAKRDAV